MLLFPALKYWALVSSTVGIVVGIASHLLGFEHLAKVSWAAATAIVLVPLTASGVRQLRRGKAGVDIIALLAMGGSLVLGQYLAGAVIALMLSGGQFLERFADSRARKELSALLERTPRIAHRYEG